MRAAARGAIVAACATTALMGAPQAAAPTLCDALAARVHSSKGTTAEGAGTLWSRLTTGTTPPIELATVSELSLERDPAADERVQFEKRFRALYGNAEALLKDLRTWDNFDILTLPGSAVRMLRSTSGPSDCESRLFFRVTVSREVVRLPDPPAAGTNGADATPCENTGGWGYFARVNGAEVFVERRTTAAGLESLRLVPLTSAGWEPSCAVARPG